MSLRKLPKKYLIPNILTAFNLLLGYLSLFSETTTAVYLILWATILDGLDGYTARLLNAHSSFGEQFDSLSDFLSFGVAPSVIFFHYIQHPLMKIFAVLFALATALRLARFNSVKTSKEVFQGLPSPVAAASLVSYILFCEQLSFLKNHPISFMFILLLTFLMLSSLPFPAVFKGFFKNKILMMTLLAMCLISIFLGGIYPFILILVYLFYSFAYGIKNSL